MNFMRLIQVKQGEIGQMFLQRHKEHMYNNVKVYVTYNKENKINLVDVLEYN